MHSNGNYVNGFIFYSYTVVSCCYFPMEIQGEYAMQNIESRSSEVSYIKVNVSDDAVTPWGQCYQKIGEYVIFVTGY